MVLVVEVGRITGARGLRDVGGNAEALADAVRLASVRNRSDDPQVAMAFRAVENVDVERAAQKQRPRQTWRRRVEQAAEKARPMADTEGVRCETLDIGQSAATGRDGRRRNGCR